MIIFVTFRIALQRSLKLWRFILIAAFIILLLTSMLALPVRGALNSGFGRSMITDRLNNGFDIEVFSDLGDSLKNLISYFSSGAFILFIVSFLLNAFLSGGLFNGLKETPGIFSAGEFFRTSAKNFWSFLVILLIFSIILFVLVLFIIIVPLSIVYEAEVPEEGVLFKTGIIALSVFFLLLTIVLLAADYARAWQVTRERNECFKAIGFGFAMTFRTFWISFPIMITILVIQGFYIFLVLVIIAGLKPVTSGGVFLLFLLSQFLFLIKMFLKVVRYGSVTALREMNNKQVF